MSRRRQHRGVEVRRSRPADHQCWHHGDARRPHRGRLRHPDAGQPPLALSAGGTADASAREGSGQTWRGACRDAQLRSTLPRARPPALRRDNGQVRARHARRQQRRREAAQLCGPADGPLLPLEARQCGLHAGAEREAACQGLQGQGGLLRARSRRDGTYRQGLPCGCAPLTPPLTHARERPIAPEQHRPEGRPPTRPHRTLVPRALWQTRRRTSPCRPR